MKVYVICDLEGTAGVVDHKGQCWFDGEYYQQSRTIATQELNSLVEGLLEGGADEIVAWDGHGNFPGGIDSSIVRSECKVVIGAGNGPPAGLDATFDALCLLGLHAMAGTPGAVLAHSFMPFVKNCWLNELEIGEIGMNCAAAGQFGVPTVFISGDKAASKEAIALIPNIECAVVKEGLHTHAAGLSQAATLCLSAQRARDLIKQGGKTAFSKLDGIHTFRIMPPYTLRTEFTEEKYAEQESSRPNATRINATTIEVSGNDLLSM